MPCGESNPDPDHILTISPAEVSLGLRNPSCGWGGWAALPGHSSWCPSERGARARSLGTADVAVPDGPASAYDD